MKYFKATLVVVALLLIGFVSGFYAHRYISVKKIKKVAELRIPRGFQDRFFEAVQADEEQKAILLPIVEEFSKKMGNSHQNMRERHKELTDSLMMELKPHLNKKQLKQLQEFNRPFRGHGHKPPGRKKKPPPWEKDRQ